MKSIDIMPTTTNPIPANKNSFIFSFSVMTTFSVRNRAKSVLRRDFW